MNLDLSLFNFLFSRHCIVVLNVKIELGQSFIRFCALELGILQRLTLRKFWIYIGGMLILFSDGVFTASDFIPILINLLLLFS